ncbi:hypothetical protein JHK87_012367 [Glycine soja]|nr:hypothetical protein JHK87_012367 [Glycine soja]
MESKIKSLFEEYYGGTNKFGANSQEAHLNERGSDDPYGFKQFFQTIGSSKTELNIYINEALELGQRDLDVMIWLKLNSGQFPILSNIARDFLAIVVSNIASESTFSTRGRVMDLRHSSLKP